MKARVVLLLALAAVTISALSQATFSAPSEPGAATRAAPSPPAVVLPPASAQTPAPAPRPRPEPRRSIVPVAQVRATLAVRERPRGPVTDRLEPSTEFGSPRVVSVAAKRGRWLGVVTTGRPNNTLAWVRRDDPALRAARVGYSLHADLSERRLELRRDGRVVKRLAVAIGRPGSATPTGRFAITDKLRGTSYGPYYGCCILALSGTQPNLPPGWSGGNRLAIHGTDSPGTIGQPASAGCLRAADADLEVLMRRVRLGTPVFIRR